MVSWHYIDGVEGYSKMETLSLKKLPPKKSRNQDTKRIISFEWKSFCKMKIIMKTNNTLLKMKI